MRAPELPPLLLAQPPLFAVFYYSCRADPRRIGDLWQVWGVSGLTAEVELLSAAVSFMKNVGLTAEDVGIKLSTRCAEGRT